MNSGSRRSLAFEYVTEANCLVLYQTSESPSDAEWDAYLELLRFVQDSNADFRVFVQTEGGRPTPPQQARLAQLCSGTGWGTAVVSTALAVRFVVSSLSLTKQNLRYFTPDELAQAYAHLELDESAQQSIERTLERFRAELRAATRTSVRPPSTRPS